MCDLSLNLDDVKAIVSQTEIEMVQDFAVAREKKYICTYIYVSGS